MSKPITRGLVGCLICVGVVVWYVVYLSNQKPSQVLRINHADPKLEAAIKQARSTLGEFIDELAKPKPDDRFAVKGEFQTEAGPEYLWVRKPVFKDGVFSGLLDQQPMALPAKKKGDSISFAKKDAVDWLIKDDQGTRGTFTEKALNGQ